MSPSPRGDPDGANPKVMELARQTAACVQQYEQLNAKVDDMGRALQKSLANQEALLRKIDELTSTSLEASRGPLTMPSGPGPRQPTPPRDKPLDAGAGCLGTC